MTSPIIAAVTPKSNSERGKEEESEQQQQHVQLTPPPGATALDITLGYEHSCQNAQLLAIILELLTFCVEHHGYHIRSFLLTHEIIRKSMALTKSKHKFLVLGKCGFDAIS